MSTERDYRVTVICEAGPDPLHGTMLDGMTVVTEVSAAREGLAKNEAIRLAFDAGLNPRGRYVEFIVEEL